MLAVIGIMIWQKVPALIAKALDGKIATIRQQLDEAAALRAEAEALLAEAKKRDASSAADAKAIVEHAEQEAKALLAKAKTDSAESGEASRPDGRGQDRRRRARRGRRSARSRRRRRDQGRRRDHRRHVTAPAPTSRWSTKRSPACRGSIERWRGRAGDDRTRRLPIDDRSARWNRRARPSRSSICSRSASAS